MPLEFDQDVHLKNLLSPFPRPRSLSGWSRHRELLSAREGEDSSNVAALTEWLWREPGKSLRHPCSLCPLADRGLARSHPPGNYGGGARRSKRRLPGCLWKGDLNLPLTSRSAAVSQLGCQCPQTLALSCLGRQRGRPRNWGPGQSSGPLPRAQHLAPECGMLSHYPVGRVYIGLNAALSA